MVCSMHLVDIAALEFRFRARQPMRLPGFTGSAWCGGFGRALRRAACITGLPVCAGCRFEQHCVYPYIFETPARSTGILADYDRVPNPFVLAPPWSGGGMLAEGSEVRLRLVLIGHAIDEAALARQAVIEAGLAGLGPDRGALDLVAVERAPPPPAEPCPDRVEIALASPLRLVEQGRLVGPDGFRPRHLLLALLRRLSLLAERHGPGPPALDYRALKGLAETAEFAERELRWTEWRRWSGRQRQLVPMGGLIGQLELPLAGLEAFWPFLALGPFVHAGKGATMGLGALRISAA
jgi:CRISPR-associated endoribonuclease Cas6